MYDHYLQIYICACSLELGVCKYRAASFWRADKTILLYIIVGVNQLSCEPETLNINKVVVHTLSRLQVIWGNQPANNWWLRKTTLSPILSIRNGFLHT